MCADFPKLYDSTFRVTRFFFFSIIINFHVSSFRKEVENLTPFAEKRLHRKVAFTYKSVWGEVFSEINLFSLPLCYEISEKKIQFF